MSQEDKIAGKPKNEREELENKYRNAEDIAIGEQKDTMDGNTGMSSKATDAVEEILSEDVKKERIEEAQEIKAKGNSKFQNGEYEEALNHYTDALQLCPKECAKQLSVLFANRAACYIKMKENLQAIKDCTSALELDEHYLKARLRRAQTYEAEEKLEDAFEDYKKVLEQDRSCAMAGEAVRRLPDQIQQKNEKLKEEMFGKLKDLGNMVLNPFGLSTENFKVQQDPSTGGYSINFQK